MMRWIFRPDRDDAPLLTELAAQFDVTLAHPRRLASQLLLQQAELGAIDPDLIEDLTVPAAVGDLADWPAPQGIDDLWVECQPRHDADFSHYAIVAHHGDPARFLHDSVVGQLLLAVVAARAGIECLPLRSDVPAYYLFDGDDWTLEVPSASLVFEVAHDILLAAAADTHLRAAYLGDCPGVDPADLLEHRLDAQALRFDLSATEAHAQLWHACACLDRAQPDAHGIKDLTEWRLPLLAEAATYLNQPTLMVDPQRPARIGLVAAPPALLERFATDIAPVIGARVHLFDKGAGQAWALSRYHPPEKTIL